MAGGESDLRAQHDVGLHAGAAEIDIAVLEASFFADVDVVFHREGRGLGLVQDPELVDNNFHLAGGDGWIDGIGAALFDNAFDGDDVFVTDFFGAGVHGGIGFHTEDGLGDAGAIAQVDEDDAAQIATAVHPAHQEDALAFVGQTQGAAIVRAFQITKKIEL